ncbi:MAG: PorT family protein [Bacteroidales bacterium]|nr:PorT family protein [Bacteroidales bacterium]
MKKLVSIFAAIILAAVLSTDADARRFGIKAGVNVTDLDVENVESVGALGYQAGISWQFDLPLGFAIQPDILYHVNATKIDAVSDQLSMGYVKVPVNVQWGLRFADRKIRVFGQASPFVSYAVSMDGGNENFAADWDNVNRFSYGAGLGAGIQLGFIQLTAEYNWAFGNSLKDKTTDELFNKGNFSGYTVSLAFMFGGKKK